MFVLKFCLLNVENSLNKHSCSYFEGGDYSLRSSSVFSPNCLNMQKDHNYWFIAIRGRMKSKKCYEKAFCYLTNFMLTNNCCGLAICSLLKLSIVAAFSFVVSFSLIFVLCLKFEFLVVSYPQRKEKSYQI